MPIKLPCENPGDFRVNTGNIVVQLCAEHLMIACGVWATEVLKHGRPLNVLLSDKPLRCAGLQLPAGVSGIRSLR